MHGSTSPPKNGLLFHGLSHSEPDPQVTCSQTRAIALPGLLAVGIEPESAKKLEDVECVGPLVRPGLAGPQAIRRLEREEPGTPALRGDSRPLGGDHLLRLVA